MGLPARAASRPALPPASGDLARLIDLNRYPILSSNAHSQRFRAWARREFLERGICVFDGFLCASAIERALAELDPYIGEAHVSTTRSTVYLRPGERDFPLNHPRRVEHVTEMGTLAEDQIPACSPLGEIYESDAFRRFVADVVGVECLHPYADGLTSVNLLVFDEGHQLGWHFDESEYAVTLLLKRARTGGLFEYAPFTRSPGLENYDAVNRVVVGTSKALSLANVDAGGLVLFRGNESLHRVTPVGEGGLRLAAVFSYDTQPGVKLSEHDRRLLYGRTA